MQRALVIGANGMDGSLMCEWLHSKGYEVFGTYHHKVDRLRTLGLMDKIGVLPLDLAEEDTVRRVIMQTSPQEIYNFGGVTFAPDALSRPDYTYKVNCHAMLQVVDLAVAYKIKCFHASSSEVFGNIKDQVCNEKTPRAPHSPYAHAKNRIDAYMSIHREQGALLYTALAFNHECARRGEQFVSRKISKQVVAIARGEGRYIELGNLDARRDWGYAPDFIEAYWGMMQHEPDEYIVSTGETHSVRDMVRVACDAVGIAPYEAYIKIAEQQKRPGERDNLVGDNTKIKKKLGWSPQTSFEEMVRNIVQYEYQTTGEA